MVKRLIKVDARTYEELSRRKKLYAEIKKDGVSFDEVISSHLNFWNEEHLDNVALPRMKRRYGKGGLF